ncbi:Ionotropic receptor 601 [Blattella germanica]|nr:Ionotropic receptor 601 [Blattella germanica]
MPTYYLLLLCLMTTYVCSVMDVLRVTDTNLHRSMVSCVENIIHKHFLSRITMTISVSYSDSDDIKISSDMCLIDMIFETVHQFCSWPIIVSNSGIEVPESDIAVLQYGYIILLLLDSDGLVTDSLQTQLEILSESPSWNPRGKFLIVLPNAGNESAQSIAFTICDILWDDYRITNVLIMTPNVDKRENEIEEVDTYLFDIYSAFPYRDGSCGKINNVMKVDQCFLGKHTFLKNDNLFPNKVPTNLNKCPVVISTVGLEPYLILSRNYTENLNRDLFRVDGLGTELLKLSAEKMNFTALFLEPTFTVDARLIIQEVTRVQNGVSEVLAGATPLIANTLAFFDGTIPFIFDTINWFVPCPKPIARMKRVLSVFTVSSWVAMAVVHLVTSVVFCWANLSSEGREQSFQSLSDALLHTWAVMMGLSFLHVPKALHLRALLILFILYCFVMSMVFQAYFKSYLVEPGYEKRLETIDDLVESEFLYGYIKMAEVMASTMEYSELKRFASRRTECKDLRSCTERIMFNGDLISTISFNYATYIASLRGVRYKREALCYLEEPILSGFICVLLRKGSPLLDRFNQLFRRCLEAGLLNRYWTDLAFRTNLENIEIIENESDIYFVFSVEHLEPIFWLLICGYGLSFTLFLWELILWNYLRYKDKLNHKKGNHQNFSLYNNGNYYFYV